MRRGSSTECWMGADVLVDAIVDPEASDLEGLIDALEEADHFSSDGRRRVERYVCGAKQVGVADGEAGERPAGIDHGELTGADGLQDGTEHKEEGSEEEAVAHADALYERISGEGSKEAACLESGDDVAREGCELQGAERVGETKGLLERWQREGAAQEARVVPEHACAHGCREHHNPDPLVVDLGRSRIRRGVVLLEEISHGDRGSNFCHDASGLGERQRSDAHSEVISCC